MRPERIAVSEEGSHDRQERVDPHAEVEALQTHLETAREEILTLKHRVEQLERERAEIRGRLEGILQALDILRTG
jgi:predicted  nucleic acid-binding Zn-ribbon protein